MPYNTPEYQAQARIISKLNDQIKHLLEETSRAKLAAEKYKYQAEFYMKMQEAILDHPALMEAWQSFMSTFVLINPEVKDWKLNTQTHIYLE